MIKRWQIKGKAHTVSTTARLHTLWITLVRDNVPAAA